MGEGGAGRNRLFWKMDSKGEERGARWPGLPGSRPRPRRRFLLSHVLPRPGFVCGAPGRRRLGSPRGPRGPRAAADLGVLSWPAAREWAERRGCRPAAGRRAWAVLGLPRACARRRNALPARAVGLGAAAAAPRGAGRPGGRGRSGSARGGEPCVTAETAALGGGESPWPGAAAASVLRGEMVAAAPFGGLSDRGLRVAVGRR